MKFLIAIIDDLVNEFTKLPTFAVASYCHADSETMDQTMHLSVVNESDIPDDIANAEIDVATVVIMPFHHEVNDFYGRYISLWQCEDDDAEYKYKMESDTVTDASELDSSGKAWTSFADGPVEKPVQKKFGRSMSRV
jgi:hypothetical protein